MALRVNSDQSAFQNCAVVGFQDSLYTHSFRQFYKDMWITGTVDFIFGNSAAVFQNSQLVVRVGAPEATTSTITAQVINMRTIMSFFLLDDVTKLWSIGLFALLKFESFAN